MVFNSLGGGRTHTYRRFHENDFKKPGAAGARRSPGLKIFMNTTFKNIL